MAHKTHFFACDTFSSSQDNHQPTTKLSQASIKATTATTATIFIHSEIKVQAKAKSLSSLTSQLAGSEILCASHQAKPAQFTGKFRAEA